MRADSESGHVSRNRLEGSLGDTPLDRLLGACHRHLVTGTLHVDAGGERGTIELRAGAVEAATLGELRDAAAVARVRELRDGMYELTQRLPDLDGTLGGSAQFTGDVRELSLVALMRHCEDNALSCTVTIVCGFDRGELRYRAGEIVEVTFNGRRDDDKIVDMVRFENAQFRVTAPPLDLDIEGWPALGREPTTPFHIDHLLCLPGSRPAPRREPTLPGLSADARTDRPGRTTLSRATDRVPALPDPTPDNGPLVWVATASVLALCVTALLFLAAHLMVYASR